MTPPLPAPPASTAPFLRASGLSRSFGERRVLTDVAFTVHAGARAGLIGQNGSGKSTLLRILAGIDRADAGTVEVPAGARIGLLRQDFPLDAAASLREVLHEAQAPQFLARARVEQAGDALALDPDDPERIRELDEAVAAAERTGAWTAESRAEAAVAGLGLASVDPGRAVETLSGGQRARLMLAGLLLARPDILLLDEPTNHLDDDAADFLHRVLAGWHGPVIAASHDRAFLDDIATEILDLDPVPASLAPGGLDEDAPATEVRGLTRTRGRYSDHVLQRLGEREAWERRYAAEQEELRRLRARGRDSHLVGHSGAAPRTEGRAARKFYADRNARVVRRRVDDAARRLEALEGAQVRRPPRELVFGGLDVAGTPRRAGAGLALREAGVTGRLAPVTLDAGPGDQVLVEGPNGSGKSTLLAILAGHAAPTSGAADVRGRVGLLSQDPAPRDPSLAVEEVYRHAVGDARADAVALPAFGLLDPRDLARPVGVLSTGQLRRLELAIILADPPEILALDEPTNHLSLDLATALESLLPGYPGIVVVASHDRWLRRRWQGQVLSLAPVTG
ncbi:ABC-F family ATP-binding cassette domain-containing protein [Schaalia naturae]|jgi:macrolide transport system ATP-binding/permease protein|uniref:ABC-F family ATP-binding cassette domain-containing protein n=3 Tax=Schaalia naturae TaxID=635203 RepID=A0ABW2SMV5_9ACTO